MSEHETRPRESGGVHAQTIRDWAADRQQVTSYAETVITQALDALLRAHRAEVARARAEARAAGLEEAAKEARAAIGDWFSGKGQSEDAHGYVSGRIRALSAQPEKVEGAHTLGIHPDASEALATVSHARVQAIAANGYEVHVPGEASRLAGMVAELHSTSEAHKRAWEESQALVRGRDEMLATARGAVEELRARAERAEQALASIGEHLDEAGVERHTVPQERVDLLAEERDDARDRAERAEADNAARVDALAPLVREVLSLRAEGDRTSLFLTSDGDEGPEVLDSGALDRLLSSLDQSHPGEAVLERLRTLERTARSAAAELRHAYHPEARDWRLVARAISVLEGVTTPGATSDVIEPLQRDVQRLVGCLKMYALPETDSQTGNRAWLLLQDLGVSVEGPGHSAFESVPVARVREVLDEPVPEPSVMLAESGRWGFDLGWKAAVRTVRARLNIPLDGED